MSASLAAGAEDAEDLYVLTGEELCGDRGSGCGADFGEIAGGDGQSWLAGFGIEKQVGGVQLFIGIGRIFRDHDQLHAEASAFRVVTRHDEKDAIGEAHLGAHRHQSRGIATAESVFDSEDNARRIESAADVVFAEGGGLRNYE